MWVNKHLKSIMKTPRQRIRKCSLVFVVLTNPADIHLSKVNNGNTRTRRKVSLKLTVKTPERLH